MDLDNQQLAFIAEHYTFDFLDLTEEHSERELERALIHTFC